MITRLLKIAAPALAVCLLCAVDASAQSYGTPTLLNGGTNNVLNAATNNYVGATGNIINATKQREVALCVTFKGSGAGTGNLVFNIDRSLDKLNWASFTNQNVAFNGTASVTNIFVLDARGVGWFRFNSIGNSNSIYATNIFAGYASKTGL